MCFLFCFKIGFSQLKFAPKKDIVFTGIQNTKDKTLAISTSINSISKEDLKINLSILVNWKKNHKFKFLVKIDSLSVSNNKYFIQVNDKKTAAYRYYNDDGFEVLISKKSKLFNISYLKIILPKNKKLYIKKLPILREK